jgi:two-component system, OmpR family, sensor histidine kinase KdpD
MTRLEHGALSIERDWVPLDDLIGSAMGRLQRYHPEVDLDYYPDSSGQMLWANGGLIEQAFFNILENAAKYSPEGETILIQVSVVGDHCRVEIEDRGPGIPEASREAIFDMFHVVAEGDKRQSGTGMGLAICRGMLAAHGGTVRAEEGAGGKGTRMVVELPTAKMP